MPTERKPVLDNKSRQLNDHDPAYHRARGASVDDAERLAEDRPRLPMRSPHFAGPP